MLYQLTLLLSHSELPSPGSMSWLPPVLCWQPSYITSLNLSLLSALTQVQKHGSSLKQYGYRTVAAACCSALSMLTLASLIGCASVFNTKCFQSSTSSGPNNSHKYLSVSATQNVSIPLVKALDVSATSCMQAQLDRQQLQANGHMHGLCTMQCTMTVTHHESATGLGVLHVSSSLRAVQTPATWSAHLLAGNRAA